MFSSLFANMSGVETGIVIFLALGVLVYITKNKGGNQGGRGGGFNQNNNNNNNYNNRNNNRNNRGGW